MIGRRSQPSVVDADKPKGFDDYDLRLGDLMRGERATMGKSLLDVQRELRIKATYIAAIENADAAAFETPGFIAGYVRSYAKYLGMDPDAAYERFCREADFTLPLGITPSAAPTRPVAKPAAVTPARDPFAEAAFIPRSPGFLSHVEPRALGSVAVLVALIGVIGYGGWSVLQQIQRVDLLPVDQAPGVVAEIDPLAGATAIADAGAAPRKEAFDRLYRPQALDVPVMEARDGPIAAINPSTLGVLADRGPAQSVPLPGQAGAPADGSAVQVVAAAAPAVEIFAVRPAWVRVQGPDGTVLFEKILDAGERYAPPLGAEPAILRAGNSGSVYFAVNGQTYGPAAPGASVAKNIVLSPDALTQSHQLADLAKDPELAKIVALAEAMNQ